MISNRLFLCTVALVTMTSAVNTNTTMEECLTWLTTLVNPQTSVVGADFVPVGCFAPRSLSVSAPNITFFNSSAEDERVACAVNCSAGVEQSTQFFVDRHQCFCLSLRSSRVSNPTAYCNESQGLVQVFDLKLNCRLDVMKCAETPRCEVKSGCCVPDGSVPEEAGIQVTLMQWMASLLMIAIILQAVWWSIRMKFRSRQDSQGVLEVPNRQLPQRTKEAALREAKIALPRFARPTMTEIDAEAHCGICLEGLKLRECLKTTCNHFFHLACLNDYLAHGLRSMTNDICCPMCRGILIVQVSDPSASSAEDSLLSTNSLVVVVNGIENQSTPSRTMRRGENEEMDEEEMMERL